MRHERWLKAKMEEIGHLAHIDDDIKHTLGFYSRAFDQIIIALQPDLQKIDLMSINIGRAPNSIEDDLVQLIGEKNADLLYHKGYVIFRRKRK